MNDASKHNFLYRLRFTGGRSARVRNLAVKAVAVKFHHRLVSLSIKAHFYITAELDARVKLDAEDLGPVCRRRGGAR